MKTILEQEREVLGFARELDEAFGEPDAFTSLFDQPPSADETEDPDIADAMCVILDEYDNPYRGIAMLLMDEGERDRSEEQNRLNIIRELRRTATLYGKAADALSGYTDRLDADAQISAEERIAATIFDAGVEVSEEDASELGRSILNAALREFRPDLFDGGPPDAPNATQELRETLADVVRALDDASGVVDAGEGERYAYERELSDARRVLAKYPRR